MGESSFLLCAGQDNACRHNDHDARAYHYIGRYPCERFLLETKNWSLDGLGSDSPGLDDISHAVIGTLGQPTSDHSNVSSTEVEATVKNQRAPEEKGKANDEKKRRVKCRVHLAIRVGSRLECTCCACDFGY